MLNNFTTKSVVVLAKPIPAHIGRRLTTRAPEVNGALLGPLCKAFANTNTTSNGLQAVVLDMDRLHDIRACEIAVGLAEAGASLSDILLLEQPMATTACTLFRDANHHGSCSNQFLIPVSFTEFFELAQQTESGLYRFAREVHGAYAYHRVL